MLMHIPRPYHMQVSMRACIHVINVLMTVCNFMFVHTQGGVPSHQRVQVMMNRILAMQWNMPSDVHISPECRDLLSKLLVANPQKRLTMQQMSEHPWFLQNLPPDALSMNHNFLNHANFTGVQTVEEIQAILRMAQTPGPGKYNFNADAADFEGVIDAAIADEMDNNTSTSLKI
uniref:Protein kinase domain-containing protein n=1 Tax=Dunaliella tertiolecta TaxID=3047 RepID=A0A7S3R1F8_DUNTE